MGLERITGQQILTSGGGIHECAICNHYSNTSDEEVCTHIMNTHTEIIKLIEKTQKSFE